MSLWSFVGLPEPSAPTQLRSPPRAAGAVAPTEQQQLVQGPVEHRGPRTPDGVPYHDLADPGWVAWARRQLPPPRQAVRYTEPDDRHRVGLRELRERLLEGDVVLIDLKSLVHLDAHRSAIRRSLAQLVAEDAMAVFSVDGDDGHLLLCPGSQVVVDRQTHDLGR